MQRSPAHDEISPEETSLPSQSDCQNFQQFALLKAVTPTKGDSNYAIFVKT